MARPAGPPSPGARAAFGPTRWSVVLAAGGRGPEAEEALATLCEAYWAPLLVYARRSGARDPEDAVQSFFARLLERGDLERVERGRGSFRGWLLTAFRHHLSNERRAARAERRGGGRSQVPLDAALAGRLDDALADARTPEHAFERGCSLLVLDRALRSVRTSYERRGRLALFEALAHVLQGEEVPHAATAARLDLSEGAVRVAAHRLREAFRRAVRAEVASTVQDPGDVEAELAALREALSP